jgi:hypothetical protein
MTKAERNRINTIKEAVKIALDNFDKATQEWGFMQEGSLGAPRIGRSEDKYMEDKKVLLSLINSI